MKKYLTELKNYILIVLGILSAGMGVEGFLLPNRFIDGGVTGVSMLLSEVLGYPLPLLILMINLPFIAVALRHIGPKFAFKSALAIGGLSLCLLVVDFPVITSDKILSAIFGGFFLGAGIGIIQGTQYLFPETIGIREGTLIQGTQ